MNFIECILSRCFILFDPSEVRLPDKIVWKYMVKETSSEGLSKLQGNKFWKWKEIKEIPWSRKVSSPNRIYRFKNQHILLRGHSWIYKYFCHCYNWLVKLLVLGIYHFNLWACAPLRNAQKKEKKIKKR